MGPDSATGLVVGTGDFVYDVFRPWGVLPAGWTFGSISHVAVDSKDRVYFYQRKDPPVLVFDGAGNFLTGWGDGRLRDAHGIYVGRDDHVYVCNRDEHEVLKLTTEGRIVLTLGHRGRPSLQAPFNHPADVALAPNGEIYVADGYGNSAIHRFSPEGQHLARGAGRAPDRGSSRRRTVSGSIQTSASSWPTARTTGSSFSPEGDFYGEWADLYHPMDIYVDGAGIVYVTDQIPRITMYAPDGTMVARGRPVAIGAHGVWGDSRGNLYLAEMAVNQVTKLVRRQRAPGA